MYAPCGIGQTNVLVTSVFSGYYMKKTLMFSIPSFNNTKMHRKEIRGIRHVFQSQKMYTYSMSECFTC